MVRGIQNGRAVLGLVSFLLCLTGCGGGGGGSASAAGGGGGTIGPTPDLGIGADLHGKAVFPADNAWNQRVDTLPVDPNSDTYINSIGRTAHLHPDFGTNLTYGIQYIVVPGSQATVPVTFDYADESDPGPYPVPANAPIEGGTGATGDRHVLVIDRDHWKLYEMDDAVPQPDGSWHAISGAVFDLNSDALRPAGWTSADAAGLPIFPGLARYDEVVGRGRITHALRFTVPHTQHGYVAPARHYASTGTDPALPPMGLRVRLKAGFDISGYPPQAQVILKALKTYGMILADNGSPWFFSGASDSRWDDAQLNALKALTGDNFEVVKSGPITTH